MASYIRSWVSGDSQRMKEKGVDLDLTYITPRIIAMSFPASDWKKLYRNSIQDVKNFLKTKHDENYWVFNLSENAYSDDFFEGHVTHLV